MLQRKYIAIDLKSFYASVECVDRGLDPLKANLVVADPNRTEKTICLAVSPSLKSYGIPGRARLFEVVQRVGVVNEQRRLAAPGRKLTGESSDNPTVLGDPSIAVGYIVAPPRMSRYMEVSSRIFAIYLKYVAPEDIVAYSCDEIFADVTNYLKSYSCTARELAMRMIRDVLATTGITATAGVGTNLFLAKVAMDIKAKHQEADSDGVRIAELDEMSFRHEMWSHTPLTDFWRIGRKTAEKLESRGMKTMGDIARCSLNPDWEEWFYKHFGVGAELLIDHAWGYEPCTMPYIKAYRPQSSSISRGQVLKEPYSFAKAKIVLREMVDNMALTLVSKRVKTDQMGIVINYDKESHAGYDGELVSDWYGRTVPKPAHGSVNLERFTSSSSLITEAVIGLYDRITDRKLTVRRITISANHLVTDDEVEERSCLSLFGEPKDDARERRMQEAILEIKNKYGKNAILKGTNFEDGATARERNAQIGGHKA